MCVYHNVFILTVATEWIGVAQRSYAACLSQVLAAVGQVMFLAIVYFVRDWRLDQFIMAGPLAFVVIYIWYVCSCLKPLQCSSVILHLFGRICK